MPKRGRPIPADVIEADYATVSALQTLADYQPTNALCSIENLLHLGTTLSAAKQAWVDTVNAEKAARKVLMDVGRLYHDTVVDSRTQVVAQYGRDSAAVGIIGLTRQSQRKRPTKR
jgi:hypothetical protein